MSEIIITLIVSISIFACIIVLAEISNIRDKRRYNNFENMLSNNTDYQNLKIKQNNLLDNYLKATELRKNIEEKEKELKYFPKDYIDLELQKMKTDFQKISTDYYAYIATQGQINYLYETIRKEAYCSNSKLV